MGYELRRRVADTLPAGLSSGERLVVLEFADQANDRTHLAYGRELLATVAHRCGFADTKQVGKVLGKLAKRGIELRVQLTARDGTPLVDKAGRPVFAHDSRSTTYRIPDFAAATPDEDDQAPDGLPDGGPLPSEDPPAGDDSPPVVPPAGDHFSTGDASDGLNGLPGGGPQAPSGPPLGGQWSPAGDPVVPRPGVSGPPSGGPLSSVSPHLPSHSPQSVVADARGQEALEHLTGEYGLTDEQAAIVWSGARRMARGGHVDQPVPYLKAMAVTGTLARLVQAVQLAPGDDLDGEDARPDLQLVDGPAPHDRSVREALAAAYQPPILATVDDPAEDDRPAAPGPDEARARRGADYARKLLAARKAAL